MCSPKISTGNASLETDTVELTVTLAAEDKVTKSPEMKNNSNN